MNWATMQTIDPFRWALSGGYRSVDTATLTILEKAWASTQGGLTNFPLRGTGVSAGHFLPTALVSVVTPFTNWGSGFKTSVWSRGNLMVFSGTGDPTAAGTDLSNLSDANKSTKKGSVYQVYVRVKVCDATDAAGGLETNCVQYGSNYKPEGLLQKYANKIRYSAFSYLNAGGDTQQGGVMRAPMGFIGPTYPQPLSSTVLTNSRSEWSSTDGTMNVNPDTTSATDSGVAQSGVMNYLNKFGQSAKNYMTYDNVSELYYAIIRNFRNMSNVPEWTNSVAAGASGAAAKLDGFPAVVDWSGHDPIAYSCQKNFILGIGDDHYHYDYNVGGGTASSTRAKPALVSADTQNQASVWTNNLQLLEGITTTAWWNVGGTNSTYYIAGLAYGAHVNDIRPDLTGTQTISTYWMDVMEYQRAEDRNPYYLAAKYGGFTVPAGYSPTNTTTPLTQSWWNTGGATINMNGNTRLQPDNYFLAGNAAQMVAGLTKAFSNIANAVKAYTTSFSLSSPQVASTGAASYASQYDSSGWTGTLSASTITFAANGTPSSTLAWSSATTFESQLAGTGWDTNRRVVTWNASTTAGAGIPFRLANLTASGQLSALATSYGTSNTTNYLNYLRGDRTNETTSISSGSTKAYRSRALLLGDIVDSKVTPVAPPSMLFSDAVNPGYAAFKTTYASRPTMVYFGANDGMLHAFNGALNGASAGTEQFAYVPSGLFQGPNGTPQVDGLAALGDPNYVHHHYVDATPLAFDIDFNNAGGTFTATRDWHTLLIGGLGKGGKSFYGIDVTDPANMNSEAAVAGKVKWEFTDATMGYSYGAPTVIKTQKYGWVVVLTSGYNNSDSLGYIYFVHPKTGALLERVSTGTTSHGLTHASAYVNDYTDGTADAIYVGDLDGQLWRFDITAAIGAYPAPVKIATLTSSSGAAQPVTTRLLIEIQPLTKKRFVMLGTGQLLASSDIASAAAQTFYAILDGNAPGFSSVTTPITRSDLTAVTDLTLGVALSNTTKGWYTDLGSTSGIGWRVTSNPLAYNGSVAFTTLLTSGDACSPSGQSRIYAIDFGTGKSILTPAGTSYVSSSNAITDLNFVKVDQNVRLVAGDVQGTLSNPPIAPPSSASLRLLNWREVPTLD